MSVKKIILSTLLCAAAVNGRHHEHDSILSILNYVIGHDPAKVLIACDIDNTLACTRTLFGGDEWFCAMYPYYAQEYGITFDEAINQLIPYYNAIQNRIPLMLCEPWTATFINSLQRTGFKVMGLTARNYGLADRTITQLTDLDIDFSQTKDIYQSTIDGFLHYPYHYKQGIIFCSSNNKGEILFKILEGIGYIPELIIMIDDKEKNLHAVHAQAEKHEIPFVGIRYSKMDSRGHGFDPEQGDKELQEFLKEHGLSFNGRTA